MIKKKKYTTLDELNEAQKKMARASALIEDDFISIVKNPLNIFQLKDSTDSNIESTSKAEVAKISNTPKPKADDNSIMNIAGSILNTLGGSSLLGVVSNIVLPLLPTKKIGSSIGKVVLRNAVQITTKVLIVNIAIWGFKQLRKKKSSNSRKK